MLVRFIFALLLLFISSSQKVDASFADRQQWVDARFNVMDSASAIAARIWPTGSGDPLQQNNGFGPRLKTSEGYRYDYHRGVDIGLPFGTTLYAIADGVVSINGSHPSYADGVVQIRHSSPGSPRHATFYATYLHVNSSLVTGGQTVLKGDAVALSGATESFEHLHFEIRESRSFQRNCTSPWAYLPYVDTVLHNVSLNRIVVGNNGGQAELRVNISFADLASELDVYVAGLQYFSVGSNFSASDEISPFTTRFDFISFNQDTEPWSVSAMDIPAQVLDTTTSVLVEPLRFSRFSASRDMSIEFTQKLNLPFPLTSRPFDLLRIFAGDVHGNLVGYAFDLSTCGSGICTCSGLSACAILGAPSGTTGSLTANSVSSTSVGATSSGLSGTNVVDSSATRSLTAWLLVFALMLLFAVRRPHDA